MLHEILLSLSGHPSPLLREAAAAAAAAASREDDAASGPPSALDRIVTPPERALLASLARLSDLHVQLLGAAAHIAASHPSTVCRAVATTIESAHLAAFQAQVLEVEDAILRRDAAFVGAYDVVPLTAVAGAFEPWARRLQWLWDVVRFVQDAGGAGGGDAGGAGSSQGPASTAAACTGAKLIDWLRGQLQTGYVDIEQMAATLVRAAERAWLKQAAAWILYGQLPRFGAGDFFVRRSEASDEEDFVCVSALLPSFVSRGTADSMLFIGGSLRRIRARRPSHATLALRDAGHLSSQLGALSQLTFPLDAAVLARTVTQIRRHLSRTTLQTLLPLAQVVDLLVLLRDFFLLGRGEFAMALTQQADLQLRSRWRRADPLAAAAALHEETKKTKKTRDDGLPWGAVVLKEGEVAAVLAKTWAALGSMQGRHAEEDEGMEAARALLRLVLRRSSTAAAAPPSTTASQAAAAGDALAAIAPTPFRNLLLSVPAALTLQIPSPLDLFLSPSDLQVYSAIHAYLISIRRAHLRLTDLWKISSLRRHHPPPPAPSFASTRAGREQTRLLRGRHTTRENAMRSAWATSRAALFFLAELEAYLQTEVVAGLWEGFQRWIQTGSDEDHPPPHPHSGQRAWRVGRRETTERPGDTGGGADALPDDASPPSPSTPPRSAFLHARRDSPAARRASRGPSAPPHDPQSLAVAHRVYLQTLVHRLLLSRRPFTDPLYELLVQIDRLVALVHRLDGVWTAADLEADVGVVDAFVDHEREERDVRREIRQVEGEVRQGVEGVVAVLRGLEGGSEDPALGGGGGDAGAAGSGAGDAWSGEAGVRTGLGDDQEEEHVYVPSRVGGIDRLLMKLDFGTWLESGRREDADPDDDERGRWAAGR